MGDEAAGSVVEDRLRQALAVVAGRVEVADAWELRPPASSSSPGRRGRAWLVAAVAVLVLAAGGAVALVARDGGEPMRIDPRFSPMSATRGGATVIAAMSVGGGQRCLGVVAVDGRGRELEVEPQGDQACLPEDATDQVAVATATIAGTDLTVVTALAGRDYRSLGTALSAIGSTSDRREGPGPALLAVADRPGATMPLQGQVIAHRELGQPSTSVDVATGEVADPERCLARGPSLVCLVEEGGAPGLRASGLAPGTEVEVDHDLTGSSRYPVGPDGQIMGTVGWLSFTGFPSPFTATITATAADGTTLSGEVSIELD